MGDAGEKRPLSDPLALVVELVCCVRLDTQQVVCTKDNLTFPYLISTNNFLRLGMAVVFVLLCQGMTACFVMDQKDRK